MPRKKSDAPTRDWSAKGDVREVIEEYLAQYPDGLDRDGQLILDPPMRRVLKRLAGDERARTAISAITKTAGEVWELADLCMDAERTMRTFHQVLTEEREMVERLHRHRQSVEDLREFIGQVSKHPDHPGVGWVAIGTTEEKRFHTALNRIAALIELRQETADIAIVDLGVTRKSAAKTAAETAAIGWLADFVASYFNKPFALQVAILAEVAFGIGEVSEDRVREARKARKRRYRVDSELVRSVH